MENFAAKKFQASFSESLNGIKHRKTTLIPTRPTDRRLSALGGGLNRSTQHFIFEGKDGV
jgi:hypothetical protein